MKKKNNKSKPCSYLGGENHLRKSQKIKLAKEERIAQINENYQSKLFEMCKIPPWYEV